MTLKPLCLGTVQFGLNYGISNEKGQVSVAEIRRILELAEHAKIEWLDTACDYGESEQILGSLLPDFPSFKLATKSGNFDPSRNDFKELKKVYHENLVRSLNHLNRTHVEVYNIRDLSVLIKKFGTQTLDWVTELKETQKIEKISVSVYTAQDIEIIMEHIIPDIIQVPISVLDQRLLEDGTLKSLKNKDVEIHARSVFLQGLIFMSPATINPFFDPIRPALTNIYNLITESGLTPLEASLGFVMNCEFIDQVIIGVTNTQELQNTLQYTQNSVQSEIDWESFKLDNSFYLNPSNWII